MSVTADLTTITVEGTPVRLRQAGSGPPLLYLHGASTGGLWFDALGQLAERYIVYAPEHPGFGESARPDWLEGIDDLVYHYLDVLAALGLDRAHVVGHSVGGWIAAELAVAHPEKVDRLALVGAAGLGVSGAPIADLFAMTPEQLVATVFEDKGAIPSILPAQMDLEYMVQVYRERTTLAALAWNPTYDPKLRRRLRRVTSPTLVLWGENDRLIPRAHGEAYAAGIPNARLAIVPGTGHMVPLERPAEFARRVAQFLAAEG